MPSSSVTLWLMRSFEGNESTDAQLDIKKSKNTYTVHYTDKTLKCNDTLTFTNSNELMQYIDIFTRNILADRDASSPFHSIQYIVPGFPATVIRREDLHDNETYDLLCDTLNFYMMHCE
jgi:hypothetical protein